MRKILFFVPDLGGGGAEMHVLRLINHLDPQHFVPVLAVVRCGGSYESRLRPGIRLVECGRRSLPSAFLRAFSSVPRLRRLLDEEKPDLAIGYVDHAFAVLSRAARGRPGIRVIGGLQNNLDQVLRSLPRWAGWWLRGEILRAYRDCHAVIALSQGAADTLARLVPGTAAKTHVIYNAGYDATVLTALQESPEVPLPPDPVFVACGRLTAQKNFPLLLHALAQVNRQRPANLLLLGDGPLRSALEAEAAQLGLADRVVFAGFRRNPYAFMHRATAFVLSSDYEGFGNVVTEAMACGTPVVSTDCPHGPREILESGKWGALVPVGDAVSLAAALLAVLADPAAARLKADAARRRATDFEAGAIVRQHESLFSRLTAAT